MTVCVYVYMYVYSMLCGGMQSQVRHYIQCATTSSSSSSSPHDPIPTSYIHVSRPLSVRAARSRIRVRLFGSMHPTKREHGSRTAHPNTVKQLGSHSLSLRVLIWVTTCSVHHPSIILFSLSLLSQKARRARLFVTCAPLFSCFSLSLSSSP